MINVLKMIMFILIIVITNFNLNKLIYLIFNNNRLILNNLNKL